LRCQCEAVATGKWSEWSSGLAVDPDKLQLHEVVAGMKTRGYSVKFTGENRA